MNSINMTTREIRKKIITIRRATRTAIQIIERDMNEAIKIQKQIAKKQDLSPGRVLIATLKMKLQVAKDQERIYEEAEKAILELTR